jgi:hypothetical protein
LIADATMRNSREVLGTLAPAKKDKKTPLRTICESLTSPDRKWGYPVADDCTTMKEYVDCGCYNENWEDTFPFPVGASLPWPAFERGAWHTRASKERQKDTAAYNMRKPNKSRRG